jgi:adenylyltransferase/sulfurtransferase
MQFRDDQIERYSRHIILPDVGGKGQERLLASKVLVIGAGGLGSPCALYLAAAGVGTIGVVDSDRVDLSNLQRQILHRTADVGTPKADSAKAKLEALNPDVRVIAYRERLTSHNIRQVLAEYDLVVDGSDNFPTKYLANDAAVLMNKPLIHTGIFRYEGQLLTILPRRGPCYRCLFPEPPPPGLVPSCQEAGILGSVAGVMGALQATEALKLLLGVGQSHAGRLLIFNALEGTFRNIAVPRMADCLLCGDRPTITELVDYELFCSGQAAAPAAGRASRAKAHA